MKTARSIFAVLLVGCVASTMARPRNDGFVDSAPVLSATPLYETVRVAHPVEECWNERVEHHSRHDSPSGALAGGIVGGVIGNQFGRGDGKTAMTVAGSLLGLSIGRDLSREEPRHPYVTRERRCQMVDRYEEEERLTGFRVEYRYQDRTFVTHTQEHPGERISLRVTVEPLEH